jgi:DNA-binding FadR family transcriptional regulator
MTSRQILDAIRRGLEESARQFADERLASLPQPKRPARSIGQMTPREILDAIREGLEETARQFSADLH